MISAGQSPSLLMNRATQSEGAAQGQVTGAWLALSASGALMGRGRKASPNPAHSQWEGISPGAHEASQGCHAGSPGQQEGFPLASRGLRRRRGHHQTHEAPAPADLPDPQPDQSTKPLWMADLQKPWRSTVWLLQPSECKGDVL